MNKKMISFILGRILIAEAIFMLPSVIIGMIYREAALRTFGIPILISAVLGLLLGIKKPQNTTIYSRDGFFVVALSWIVMAMIGAIPLYLSGHFPSLIDAIFETVSGFTTTGASVLSDVESLPKSVLFWRSFSHWIGGMGVLVFVLAIVPLSDDRSLHLMRAEVPGPIVGKLVPRMRKTALILYTVYTALTVILAILLLCGGMPLFDALCNAFGTAGTGGFSVRNAGIAYYDSAYVDIVLSIFMLLFGINFNLFYLILIGKVREALKSEELRWYLGIIGVSTLVIAYNCLSIYKNVGTSLRYAFFQVTAIISSTGFATADFTLWQQFSQHLLVLLMFVGACAGSTGGGLKVSRVLLICKTSVGEIRKLLHPRAVKVTRLEGKPVEQSVISGTLTYFAMYVVTLFVSVLLLSLDGFDFATNVTAGITCLNNIGPGLSAVGPYGSFADYSWFSKLLLAFDMLLGRLEIFPILVLFTPSSWGKNIH